MKLNLYFLKTKITTLFKQGLSPKELSQSVLLSAFISVIPIIGISTFIITTIGVALRKKLNLPVMLALNYLLWPVQILLIIPFIRAGKFIFSIHSKEHTIEAIVDSFQISFFKTLSNLSFELLCGLGAWLIIAVPITVGIYFLILIVLKVKNINY